MSVPARGLVLVRPAETEESIPGGKIVLPQSVRDGIASYQFEVIAVGLPEICEDEDCERDHDVFVVTRFGSLEGITPGDRDHEEWEHPIPDSLVPGAWVVVQHRSLSPSDDPYGKTFYVRQVDVLAVLRAS